MTDSASKAWTVGTLTAADIARLLEAAAALAQRHQCSQAEAVDLMVNAAADPVRPAGKPRGRFRIGKFAERLRRVRLRRNQLIGAPLFRDPAWDMMLDLYAANERRHRISVSSLCLGSGVPPTTALRHVTRLEAHGMLTREGDTADLRRSWVSPTPKAIAAIGTLGCLFEQAVTASYADPAESGEGSLASAGALQTAVQDNH
jgi:DNA-binding MarR family transcriptional regulator